MNANPRLSLIVTAAAPVEREWTSAAETTRLLFLDSFAALEELIREDIELDVERVVLESGSAAAVQFLSLLARVGSHFTGDLLFVSFDGSGFLSSVGRGGDRVLYALSPNDVDFYLHVHKLTSSQLILPDATVSTSAQWVNDAQLAMSAA